MGPQPLAGVLGRAPVGAKLQCGPGVKRSIIGSYHQLSAKHLPAYLDEVGLRFNNRENEYLFRDTLMALVGAETTPYQQLIRDRPSKASAR
jgi:hypothetical protein